MLLAGWLAGFFLAITLTGVSKHNDDGGELRPWFSILVYTGGQVNGFHKKCTSHDRVLKLLLVFVFVERQLMNSITHQTDARAPQTQRRGQTKTKTQYGAVW